jgi:hypothetical protein
MGDPRAVTPRSYAVAAIRSNPATPSSTTAGRATPLAGVKPPPAKQKSLGPNSRDAIRHLIFAFAHPVSAFRQPDSTYPKARTAYAKPEFTFAHLKSAYGSRKSLARMTPGHSRIYFSGVVGQKLIKRGGAGPCRWRRLE